MTQASTNEHIAVAYYRFSSASQNEASIEIQRKYVHQYAQENGIPIIHEYIDEAMTGTNANRPGFQQMIYDSARRQFDLVLIYADSRFGRNALDVLTYTDKLRLNGVSVFSVTEQYRTDTPSGNLMHMLQVAINENYSKELQQKIVRGNHQKLQEGKSIGHQYIGLKVNEDRLYEIDPASSDIIKQMFHKYAYENYTIIDCINFLNNSGLTNTRGSAFKRHTVRSILSNPIYNGHYVVAGIDYGMCIPKLIDDDTFNAVQRRLNMNKIMPALSANKHSEDYILTPKLFCECGSHMQGVSAHNHDGIVYRYYACSSTRGKDKSCECKPIRKEFLEDTVQKYVTALFTDEFIHDIAHRVAELSAASPNSAELASAKASLRKTRKAIDNLVTAIENGIDVKLISPKIEQRKKEETALENRIRELELNSEVLKEDDIVAFLSQFKDYKAVSESMRKLIVNVLVKRITVFYDGSQLRMTITYNCSNNSHEKSEPTSFGEGSPNSSNGGADGSRTRVQE